MPLLSRKTKTDAAEFAKSFYDRHVFGPGAGGDDFSETFADVARRRIAVDAPSFAEVGLSELTEELRALRLEMIGTAWTHKSKVQAALAVSECTKAYLSAIGRSDLWEAMGEYNQAVAESVMSGRVLERGTDRAFSTLINAGRMDFWKKWHEGRDGEAVARVANRFESKASLKSGALEGSVALQVTRRLGIEGSDPVWFGLGGIAHGFYQGASEALDGVQLVP